MKRHQYLLAMPNSVLFGQAKDIEKWCHDHDKARPTLLDLERARAERRANARH